MLPLLLLLLLLLLPAAAAAVAAAAAAAAANLRGLIFNGVESNFSAQETLPLVPVKL